MSSKQVSSRAHWGSRLAFILAAAGSAVGLGNIWKFPYITGQNGGGAFVLIYLACITAVGIPIFIAELYIGQRGQKNTVESFEAVHRKGSPWRMVGWLGLLSAFLILSFYSVVGGWVLEFEARSIANHFAGHSEEEIKGYLSGLFANPWRQLFWHFVFMAATVGMVIGGVKDGLERANKIMMPGLVILLAALLGRSFFLEGFSEAVTFLFRPDFSKLSASAILEAVGHSFFTLSLGMGAMITYGSYLDKKESLTKTVFAVAAMDTMIALTAGIVVFSVVFSFGLAPGSGPTLMFQTLPVLFSKTPGAYFISIAFFLLIAFAALTSSISLLEVVVAYWTESHNTNRTKTALVAGGVMYALGILSVLSMNVMSEVKIFGLTFFDLFDKITSQAFLPVGGMAIALFFGWVLGPKAARDVIGRDNFWSKGLLWATRTLAPLAVLFVLISKLNEWS